MKPHMQFAFRIIVWTDYGLQQVAGSTDFAIALAAYLGACARWPHAAITLEEGARVIEDRRWSQIASL